MAALKLFPHAQIITHKDYSHTFAIEAFRSAEESDFFVEPHVLVSDEYEARRNAFAVAQRGRRSP